MKKWISQATAAKALQILFGIFVVFHLLVLIGIIPDEIVWGGRISSGDELIVFELISISILLVSIVIVRRRLQNPDSVMARGGIWLLLVVFVLNSIGNLFAESATETILFTPITTLISLLLVRMLMK